ncbi:MAG: cytidine deaminase [Pseudomonadota bacterium]
MNTRRGDAYCPYSHFSVGAALVDETGHVHIGCNVENSAYPEGTCAEAGAIASMIASGARRIRRIVVAGGHDEIETCTPCGGCRQKIAEFGDDETVIVLVDGDGETTEFSVDELLPLGFRLEE